jgi:hypothetical protein
MMNHHHKVLLTICCIEFVQASACMLPVKPPIFGQSEELLSCLRRSTHLLKLVQHSFLVLNSQFLIPVLISLKKSQLSYSMPSIAELQQDCNANGLYKICAPIRVRSDPLCSLQGVGDGLGAGPAEQGRGGVALGFEPGPKKLPAYKIANSMQIMQVLLV